MRTTNLFILRGYTGADPKAFDNGKIAKVSVATNRRWKDRKGEWVEKTDWVTCTILNERTAEFVLKHVKKGAPVYAECRVADASYQKNGETVYTTEVVANVFDLLSSREENGDRDDHDGRDEDDEGPSGKSGRSYADRRN